MAVVEDLRGPTCVALERWIAFHRQALGFMPGWETLRAEAVRSCAGTPAMLRPQEGGCIVRRIGSSHTRTGIESRTDCAAVSVESPRRSAPAQTSRRY
jgi:hypothetical protein